MSFAEFAASVARDAAPPPGLTPPLAALWWDGRGDWQSAHLHAQEDRSADAAWVHAYLHRKEGDRANASYWYQRASRATPPADVSLPAEWEQIARELLGDRASSP